MRVNGTLQYATLNESELDESGEVVEAVEQWSELIPCNIQVNRNQNKKAYSGGAFRDVSLTILIEQPQFPYTKIRVYDRAQSLIGEYPVLSAVALDTFDRTQILV